MKVAEYLEYINGIITALNPVIGIVISGVGAVADLIAAFKNHHTQVEQAVSDLAATSGVAVESLTLDEVLARVAEYNATEDAFDPQFTKDPEGEA